MRKPLMAGNWKMNLNHLEAIAVAQKLVYGLDDKDYDAVDVAVTKPGGAGASKKLETAALKTIIAERRF